MKYIIILILITFLNFPGLKAQSNVVEKESFTSNEFDFWIGEWDVNLRVFQNDQSWKTQHKSIARIYSVLDGKAILELWEEQGREKGIMGYSLRYYDTELKRWVLWLNWPGENRSGSSSLEGSFRHKRGEFFSTRKIDDSTSVINRYTFSDITDNSLRWDDAYSRDGGRTWSNNWIMEFSRIKEKAVELKPGFENHTNFLLNRCTLEEFDWIKKIPKIYPNQSESGSVTFYGILDGCSAISILQNDGYEELSVFTFNTYAQVYEVLVFDSKTKKAHIYYGKLVGDTLYITNQDKSIRREIEIKQSSYRVKQFIDGEKVLSINISKKD